MNTTATAMSSLESLLAQPLVNAVGWALVHFVWHGAAVAAVVAVLLAVLRRASANVRYLVACVALLVLACMPIVTAWCVYPQPPTRPRMSNDRAENLHLSLTERDGARGAPLPQDFVERPADPDSLSVATAPLVNPSSPPARPLHARAAEWIEHGLPWLVAAWLAGVLGLSARLLAGWAHVQRIRRRHARPAAEPWPARLAELARRLRVTRPVRLLESAIVEVPIVIGWLRPVILLPASALVGLTPHQLEALLAHELAHIRRQDYLVNLLQTIVETLLFYHPAVWWVSRRIRAEREECCDDLAVSVCGDRVVYARALASMEEIRGTRPQLGVAADGGPLLARIRRLVGVPAPQASRSAWWVVAAVALAVSVALGAGMRLSTSASQAQESEARPDNEAVEQGLVYMGQVTDHDTGQPIESATVVVRQMLVRVEPESIGKVLAESKHQTTADGKYSFAILPEHAAKPLYIKIDVHHPKYAPIMGEGYSLDMIRKNQQLGDPPFFAAIRLRQAGEIHGQVVTPDGEPATGVRVLALTKLEINEPARNFEMLRTEGSTDDQGRFRLMPSRDGRLLIYLESNNYSPLIKLMDGRGDLGRFTLQEGITLKGRLLDSAGQPLPVRWVVARPKQEASVPTDQHLEEARQVFYFQANRSALTNDRGEYALAPLPAGAYSVTPAELAEHCFDYEMRPRPLSAVFYPRDAILTAGAAPDPLDFRAVSHVTVDVQCVNSKDEPQPGQEISIQGGGAELNQPIQWNSTGITDSAGKVRLLVPRGLEGVGLYTIDNEHHAVTFQQTKDSPPVPGNLKLGIVNEAVTGIILRRYASPIVLIKVSDEDGAPLSNVEIRVSNRSYTCWIEKHGDGQFRTAGLMPDAEATISVKATGYQTRTEKITLPESSTKDLEFVLEKERQANVITPEGGVDDREVRELLDKLKDPNQRERRGAVRALGLLGPRATPTIPALIDKLKDDDPYIRTWAAFGLGRIGAAAKEAVPALEAALDDPFGPTRREAAEALFRVDRQANKSLAVLCELLGNPPDWPDPGNDDVAVSSQLMYFRAETTWAIGHIVRYAREAQPPVDASADAKRAVPILIDQLKVSHLRGPSLYSLGMIGKAADAAIPAVVQLLQDRTESSEPISVALARIGHDPAFVVPALLDDLQSDEVRIRFQVIESLGELGPHAKAAVPELRKALEDDDDGVRAAAKKALLKIGAADGANPESAKPAAAQLPGRIFVGAGLRTTEDETRFFQLAIAIDPNAGKWTQLQNLSLDANGGFTVPLSPVRVSPDGRTILFMREKELWKCDARAGERPERVLEKGSPAAWSPDGKTFFAVVSKKESDYQAVENWKVSADGGDHSVLRLPDADVVEDWSPDGQWLAVMSRKDGQLYVVKPDGSGRRRLTDTDTNASRNDHPRFSPDSRHIVYHRTLYIGEDDARESHFSLRTVNADGTDNREILGETAVDPTPNTAPWTAPMGARWSPDGKHMAVVLFDHSRGGGIFAINGNWRLAIIDADGGNLRELALEGVLNTVLPWDGPEWRPEADAEASTRGPAGARPPSD